MRIDAYNQIAQVYKTTSAAKLQKTENARHGRDEVQISSFGRDYQIAKQAVAETSDIRDEKVSKLKASVQSGDYKVDSGDFANKLFERYQAKQF
jgi:negative regulator of flagellin synthesis FlgM